MHGIQDGGSHLKTEGLEKYGCAAATVTIGGTLRLLSAAHVLTIFDRGNIGKTIYLRSYNETGVDGWEPAGVVSGQIDVHCYPMDRELHPERATQDLACAVVNDGLTTPQHIERIGRVDIRSVHVQKELLCAVNGSCYPFTNHRKQLKKQKRLYKV